MRNKLLRIGIALLVMAVFVIAIPQRVVTADSKDPYAWVSKATLQGNILTVTGTLPCPKWQARITQETRGNKIYVEVRRHAAKNIGCAQIPISYRRSIVLEFKEHKHYKVFVNGVLRFEIDK